MAQTLTRVTTLTRRDHRGNGTTRIAGHSMGLVTRVTPPTWPTPFSSLPGVGIFIVMTMVVIVGHDHGSYGHN